MSIWISGDCHSDVSRFNTECFPEQYEMTKDDIVLICGDFGLVWNRNKESKTEKWWLDWLEDKPFTVCFVDGNHENHVRLNEYPVKEWNGGRVHEIRPHVLHLMRGEVFKIQGKKFFTFGGASSHDVQDGILDYEDEDWREKAKKLDKQGKYMYRVKGLTWWSQELPNQDEMNDGIANLEEHDWKVDYIITHSPYTSLLKQMDGGSGLYESDILTDYLQEIKQNTDYKQWIFGHMHLCQNYYWERATCIYEQIVRIV